MTDDTSRPGPDAERGAKYRLVVTEITPGHEKCLADLSGWVPLGDLMTDTLGDLVNSGLIKPDGYDTPAWEANIRLNTKVYELTFDIVTLAARAERAEAETHLAIVQRGLAAKKALGYLAERDAALAREARLREALTKIAAVEKQIRLAAYASAGDPSQMDNMRMFAIWAGSLQAALSAEPQADAGERG